MLSGARRAFTLTEIIVALMIIAALAAALYPAVGAQWRRGQSVAVGKQLSNIREAVTAYRENVDRYPRTISQLINTLTVTATDACAGGVPTANRNRWRGPYLTQAASGDLPVGDATVRDTLIRVPASDAGTAAGILQVRVFNVDSSVAAAVDRNFDGTLDLNNGSILWSAAGDDTLRFQILIRNC